MEDGMYRVYVLKQRRGGSEVIKQSKTETPLFAAAEAAFWALYNEQYDDLHLLLMTKNNKQLNAYRYKSKDGERDYVKKGAILGG